MEELFKIDLQLFNDDEGSEGSEVDEGQGNEGSATDDENQETGIDSPRIALDENGNVVFLDDEEDNEANADDEDPAANEDDVKKFKVKIGDEEVEVTEEELLKGYMRQGDYTRKAQELARQRQEIEQKAKALPPKEVAPPAPQEDFVQFNQRITDEAIKLAKQRLNLPEDTELSEVDFAHQNAFHLARKEIEAYLEQTTRHHRDITVMERELRVEEPEFDQVFEFMMDRLENELPARVSKEVEAAYSAGDTVKLKKFFNEMRKDYYAKKNGTDTKATPKAKTPPKLEGAGKGELETPKTKRDASVLRDPSLTFEDKVKKLKDWGIA